MFLNKLPITLASEKSNHYILAEILGELVLWDHNPTFRIYEVTLIKQKDSIPLKHTFNFFSSDFKH